MPVKSCIGLISFRLKGEMVFTSRDYRPIENDSFCTGKRACGFGTLVSGLHGEGYVTPQAYTGPNLPETTQRHGEQCLWRLA